MTPSPTPSDAPGIADDPMRGEREVYLAKVATPSEIEPHLYSPDYQAMGDCRICGHGPEKSWHRATPSEGEAMLKHGTLDFLAAIELWKTRCFAAEKEVAILRTAAQSSLEKIIDADTVISDGGKVHDHGPCAEIAIDALAALSPDTPKEKEHGHQE